MIGEVETQQFAHIVTNDFPHHPLLIAAMQGHVHAQHSFTQMRCGQNDVENFGHSVVHGNEGFRTLNVNGSPRGFHLSPPFLSPVVCIDGLILLNYNVNRNAQRSMNIINCQGFLHQLTIIFCRK